MKIELRRRELVWEERRCEYTEEDFNKWKESYKKYLMYFEPLPQEVIDKLDKLTFDIVCEYISYNYHNLGCCNKEKEDLFDSFRIKVLGRTFDLLDAAESDVREMNFDCDCDIFNTDYANDYDEDWIVK